MSHLDYAAILATILIVGIPSGLGMICVVGFRLLDWARQRHTHRIVAWDCKTQRFVPVASKRRGRS